MEKPNPINLTTDDEFRKLGWAAVARDKDGHAITLCAPPTSEPTFNEWLRECFDAGLTVTRLAENKPAEFGVEIK